MPLTKSAKKALRVERTKKIANDATRAKMKSALKAARLAVAAGNKDVPTTKSKSVGIPAVSVGTKKKIDLAYRELDIAAKKNVIHKNRASRLKSRLAKKPAAPISKTKTAPKKVAHKKTAA